MSDTTTSLTVSNQELATVRDAMRELPRLLAALQAGQLDKEMRAVLITPERFSELNAR